jgi:hypothetical protein
MRRFMQVDSRRLVRFLGADEADRSSVERRIRPDLKKETRPATWWFLALGFWTDQDCVSHNADQLLEPEKDCSPSGWGETSRTIAPNRASLLASRRLFVWRAAREPEGRASVAHTALDEDGSRRSRGT